MCPLRKSQIASGLFLLCALISAPSAAWAAGASRAPLLAPSTSEGSSQLGQPSLQLYRPPAYMMPDYGPLPPPYIPPAYRIAASQELARELLPFRPQFGIGIHVSGLWPVNDVLSYGQGGIGLDLLIRAQSRLTVEFTAQYQQSNTKSGYAGYYQRIDAPILGGLRVHVGPLGWSVSPYLAGAVGADFAHAGLSTAEESSWFFECQGGFGLEGRVGRHFAVNVDLRGFGRFRSGSDYAFYVTDAYGNTIAALGEQSGFVFNSSLAVYF